MRLGVSIGILLLAETLTAAVIPQDVKKTVVFVYVNDAAGKMIPNGTAFFVGIPDEHDPERFFSYLVTAKHVLTAGENGLWLPKVYLRMDKLEGGVETVEIVLSTKGPSRNVFVHDDPSVDLAVIPALPNQKTIDFKMLPADLITSREDFPKLGIAEGSEVFFTGLFTPHTGERKNYPVVRFGRVALLSEEKVNWNGTPIDLYLIESSSYGGNSGAPVFLYLGADRTPGSIVIGPPELRLAGVMKGAFQEGQAIRMIQTAAVPVSVANIGIAAVVPSYQLRDILFSAALKEMRSKVSDRP